MKRIGTTISVVFSLINSLRTRWGGDANLRLTARLPIITALAVAILLGVLPAVLPQSSAHAASGYLADEIGNTEISVDVDEEFSVVLWLTDVSYLAGYDCAITISGPATAIDTAVHGSWFEYGHTVLAGGTATATYGSGLLSSPTSISGSGDLVVFTLRGTDDGVVAINVDGDVLCLGDTDAEEIIITAPSTLYVTVGTGEGDSMQGGIADEQQGGEAPPNETEPSEEEQEFLDSGSTYYVDGSVETTGETGSSEDPFKTIAEAVQVADDGDTILVAGENDQDGIEYQETLTIADEITVSGGRNRAASWGQVEGYKSIIRAATANDTCVTFTGQSKQPLIEYFTMTGGKQGVHCAAATGPIIKYNKIIGNTSSSATTYGGGIELVGTNNPGVVAVVKYNTIDSNSAALGGGIDLYDYDEYAPIIDGNIITRNNATIGGGGISVRLCSDSNLMISNCIIAGNTASEGSSTSERGGGIYCYLSDASIFCNTIVCNRASTTRGGGIHIRSGSLAADATVSDCILWGNYASNGTTPSQIGMEKGTESCTATVSYSDVYGGQPTSSEIGTGCTLNWGTGQGESVPINSDPKFVSLGGWNGATFEIGNYRLLPYSPCIDKGTNTGAPSSDILNMGRPVDGDESGVSTTDMGAYEMGAFEIHTWPIPGDATLNCVVNVLDLIQIRSKLGQNPSQGSNWRFDVNEDGRINILDLIFTRNRLNNQCQ